MRKLKHKILNSIGNFLAPAIYTLLSFCADSTIFVGKVLASVYKYIWPYVGLSWFDHRFDFLRGPANTFWLERAFYAKDLINDGDRILDIGFGDGIYSGLFYSSKHTLVDAIDIDQKAVNNAKRLYPNKNVKFYKRDILNWTPTAKYNCVFMFAVIEHFNEKDGLKVLEKIGKSLSKDGFLLGSTPIFEDKGVHNFEHKNEFASQLELKRFLVKRFHRVKIVTSNWTGRLECYFTCREPL